MNMSENQIKTIAVLTSGGDAPGMNAAIRAVVRTGLYNGLDVYGVKRGYQGLVDGRIERMTSRSVSNIIQTGGTVLKTARCLEFLTYEGRKQGYENLKKRGIEALVIIGGDGSFRGAKEFSTEFDIPVVGIPGTIDNDIVGTEYTIGYDTALNTVVEAVDKIRDTASAHNRLFFIEIMGRHAGFLTLNGGIATGAEAILVPEIIGDFEKLKAYLDNDNLKHKKSSIVLVAEGDEAGGAFNIAQEVKKGYPEYDVRVTILGHIQRGGSPTARDRINASRMGVASVQALLAGKSDIMIGLVHGRIVHNLFADTKRAKRKLDQQLLDMMDILSI
jgi:6-phosphofructokinase 1